MRARFNFFLSFFFPFFVTKFSCRTTTTTRICTQFTRRFIHSLCVWGCSVPVGLYRSNFFFFFFFFPHENGWPQPQAAGGHFQLRITIDAVVSFPSFVLKNKLCASVLIFPHTHTPLQVLFSNFYYQFLLLLQVWWSKAGGREDQNDHSSLAFSPRKEKVSFAFFVRFLSASAGKKVNRLC